jgi:SAM-dependent methyltransferase
MYRRETKSSFHPGKAYCTPGRLSTAPQKFRYLRRCGALYFLNRFAVSAVIFLDMGAELTKALGCGLHSYNDVLGRWWQGQAANAAHRLAYRRIAEFLAVSFSGARLILDYACGPGALLRELSNHHHRAKLLGLDGSGYLLNLARERLDGRVQLLTAVLPDFGLRQKADVVVFAFPNLFPASNRMLKSMVREHLEPAEVAVARKISRSQPGMPLQPLLLGRLVAKNLRFLLRPGGYCVRVEYAGMPRDRIRPDDLFRSEYEEGSLDQDSRPRPWFRVVASSYCRSGVIADVYDQTRDLTDRHGGYQITVLRAV